MAKKKLKTPVKRTKDAELGKLKELIVQIAQQARKTELHAAALVDVLPTRRIAQSSDQTSCSCCCC
jgi:hypothetical protein